MEIGVKTTPENDSLDAAHTDIWSFTKAFIQVIRAQQLDQVRNFLGGLRVQQENKFFTFYTANTLSLRSGERVGAFLISAGRNGKDVSARFEVSDRCILRDEVAQHYPGWRLVAVPRGDSPEEETLFRVEIDGFAYAFGFAEKARDCLNSIGIGPLNSAES
jgi:hypothetical protein